jgi:hypothetical protein
VEGLGWVIVLLVFLAVFLVWTLIVLAWAAVAIGLSTFGLMRFFSIWIGVPVLAIVVLICVVSAISFYQSLPRVVFRDSVGFDPTKDITFLNSLRHMPTDWDDSYLEFYASDRAINRIIHTGFTPISPADIIEYCNTPKWWTPPVGPGVRIYATNTKDPEFRDKNFRYFVSHRLLIYDPEHGDPGKRKVFLRYRRP